MPAYVLPTFNLNCDVFTSGNFANPPRTTIVVNLTPGRRITGPNVIVGAVASYTGCMYILCPPFSDIRGLLNPGGSDGVEIPPGSGRRYLVDQVDDIGKGFANEHRFALIYPTGVWPNPIP